MTGLGSKALVNLDSVVIMSFTRSWQRKMFEIPMFSGKASFRPGDYWVPAPLRGALVSFSSVFLILLELVQRRMQRHGATEALRDHECSLQQD